jgi:hypothetical protein
MAMKKKLLSQVPIEELNIDWDSYEYEDKLHHLAAKEVTVNENKVLMIHLYRANPEERQVNFSYRVFLTKDDYITQDLRTSPMKWKTGAIESLLGYAGYVWYKNAKCVDQESARVIKDFLKTEDNPCKAIYKLQEEIKHNRLRKRHAAIKSKIDKRMENVPPVPMDFKEWVENIALYKSRYIYYEYKKGKKKLKAYCTHCKQDLIVESPRYNQKGTCICGSPTTYKSVGKATGVHDTGEAILIQKVDGDILLRYFTISKTYRDHYRHPKLYYGEMKRVFLNSEGRTKAYEWADFKQTGEMRWCDSLGKYERLYTAAVYDRNLEDVLGGTKYQYCALKEFITHKPGHKVDALEYLRKYEKYPVIEYLVKLKLYNLVGHIVKEYSYSKLNLKGKSIKEVLGVDKEYMPVLQRLNVNDDELMIIKESQKRNIKISDEQIRFIGNQLMGSLDIFNCSEYTTISRVIKYIKKNAFCKPGERYAYDKFLDWKDYIENCRVLGYDIRSEFVIFPKDFKKEHDKVYKLVQENQSELFDKAIKNMSNNISSLYNWQRKDYMIIAPKSAEEIIREGEALHHCVGTYIEKMAKGKSIILFLRQKNNPIKSFYTIEVKNGKVVQCRGKKNKSMTKEIEKLINRFSKEKLVPMLQKKIAS